MSMTLLKIFLKWIGCMNWLPMTLHYQPPFLWLWSLFLHMYVGPFHTVFQFHPPRLRSPKLQMYQRQHHTRPTIISLTYHRHTAPPPPQNASLHRWIGPKEQLSFPTGPVLGNCPTVYCGEENTTALLKWNFRHSKMSGPFTCGRYYVIMPLFDLIFA